MTFPSRDKDAIVRHSLKCLHKVGKGALSNTAAGRITWKASKGAAAVPGGFSAPAFQSLRSLFPLPPSLPFCRLCRSGAPSRRLEISDHGCPYIIVLHLKENNVPPSEEYLLLFIKY